MNTPDQGPKNGDFVAYLEALERKQMAAHRYAEANHAKAAARGDPHVPMAPTPFTPGTHPAGRSGSVSLTPEQLAGIVKRLPVGLVVLGVLLVIGGVALQGGFILTLIGLVMLAQAVRTVLKAVAAATQPGNSSAAQQVATILAPRPARKSGTK